MKIERALKYPILGLLFVTCLLIASVGQIAAVQAQGVVEGKLINGTDSAIMAAKVDLDVISLSGGMSIIKSGVTDRVGKFRFDGLPTDAPLMIRANYKSAGYLTQVALDSAGKASVEIKIFETTKSMNGIQAQAVRIAVQSAGDRLQALETISFNNQTNPPRTFMNEAGNYRFSKLSAILEVPNLEITSPGSVMPLSQAPLESPDGQSYYSIYPLRPGVTTFEVLQALPYQNQSYTYRKKFFYDVNSFDIGVIPQDLNISGEGLTKIQTDTQRNFSVYRGGPIKAGTEVVFTLSGGTAAAMPQESDDMANPGQSRVRPFPNAVGLNAMIIGPLLLLGFMVILWYALNHAQIDAPKNRDSHAKELKERYENLLNFLAVLENRYETQSLDRRDYIRQREQGKRLLRRISLLLNK